MINTYIYVLNKYIIYYYKYIIYYFIQLFLSWLLSNVSISNLFSFVYKNSLNYWHSYHNSFPKTCNNQYFINDYTKNLFWVCDICIDEKFARAVYLQRMRYFTTRQIHIILDHQKICDWITDHKFSFSEKIVIVLSIRQVMINLVL